MALSFEEIRDLVQEALCEKYPAVSPDGQPAPVYAERFCIQNCWQDQALVHKNEYWADESDPDHALVRFSITGTENGPGEEQVSLGDLIPMSLQAVSEDGSIVLPIESEQFDGSLDEAGRRNSKTDAKALNSAIQAIVSLLSQEDLDDDTVQAINKIILKPSKAAESEEQEEGWDGSKSRFSIDQLLRSVPRAMARWARAQAKKAGRDVTKGDLHLPYKEPDGTVNPDGVRNALARLPQVQGVPDDVKSAAKAELQRVLNRVNKSKGESENGTHLDILGTMRDAENKAKKQRGDLDPERDPVSIIESFLGEETFTEHLESVVTGTFDKKNLIIKDHKVLGIISKNGYTYPISTQQEAIPIFEGAKAYLNHPTAQNMGEARNVRDLIGYHKGVRVKEDGTYSDLHLINNRTVQDYVIPVADSAPHLIGSSVVIRGKMKKMKEGLPEIEKIYACRSIDLVSEPATTNGLYESINANTTSEETMELKDLTLDVLKKERADLVEQILASIEEGKKVSNLESQVATLQTKIIESDGKIAKLELEIANRDAAEAKRQAELEVETLVRDAKIPDVVKYEEKDGKKVIKSHFYNLLSRCASSDERKALVSDWEEACKGIPTEEKKPVSKAVSYEQKLGTDLHPITESALDKLYGALAH